jgi:Major capsid protein Gp23
MGALLESGMVGNIGLKHLRVIKEDTINKWDGLGFLEGLDGHQKDNIAQLYENQASYLINEAAVADSSGSFETVVFPIIRRVFSKLLANDIVSVQAMNLPIGKLFYFIPKIQDRSTVDGKSNSHNHPYGFPNTTDTDPELNYNGQNLYDRFYENDNGMGNDPNTGLFDYSKGQYSSVTLNPTSLVTFSNGGTTVLPISGVTGSSNSQSSLILKVTGFTKDGEGNLIGPNGNAMDTEEFLASAVVTLSGTSMNFNIVTQKYGKGIVEYGQKITTGNFPSGKYYQDTVDQEGTMYLQVDMQSYSATSGFSNIVLPAGTALTDFVLSYRVYDTLEFEDQIGEVSFDLQSVTVSVTERKLRATWSPELAQDVSAFHNIDAEAELTALLSEQIAAEVDREILRDLRKGAAWTAKWDYNGWKYGGASGATLQGYTQKDWNQTLVTKINQISAQIHKTTLRGGANWIVVSSEISAVFDDLEYFHVSNAEPEQDQYNMGIEKIGSISGRYQVYRDPYFPSNKLLIGHKGKSLLDAGYIYAPYVPLQLTPTMYNPFTMTPIKGIMTRYAKKMVNNRYFGVITVQGIQTFDLNTLR